MKYLFIILAVALVLAGVITTISKPDADSTVPVLYWVTDPNPARQIQIEGFYKWLIKNGFIAPDDPTKPCMLVKVDAANAEMAKKIVQGVSGVGGDIMDLSSAAGMQIQMYQIGLLDDVTDTAETLTNKKGQPIHFDPSKTYPAIAPNITILNEAGERRQIMFPCNVTSPQYWVNRGVFEKVGMTPPDHAMNVEEFERLGKEFVKCANKGKEVQDTFLADRLQWEVFVRSFGMAYLNETMTASVLDDPRYVKALEYLYKWTYEDRILPSLADLQSASASAGYGGQGMSMFNEGKFAMFTSGRYALIRFREIQKSRRARGDELLKLGVVPPVYAEFPNSYIATRGAAVYIGGKHKDFAKLFLAYLASKEYNECIVADGDALPPNPEYVKTEEFTDPKEYPDEKGCHEPFAKAALNEAIAMDFSQFISPGRMVQSIELYRDKFMNGQMSAADAASATQESINDELARTVSERPYLQGEYKRLCDLQKKIDSRVAIWKQIDELKKNGKAVPESLEQQAKKIPLDWLYNPFHRRYYQHKGWAE